MISKNNIKLIHALQKKKFREETGQFIAEGEKLVTEAIRWNASSIVHLYYTSEFHLEFPKDISISATLISEKELKQLSSLQTPNKALAIVRKPEYKNEKHNFYIALDGIQDPGNMGTIMRLADWFGVHEIICSEDTVDCYNPKVVQATMGAIFRVRVRYSDLRTELDKSELPIYGALLNGENVYGKELKPEGILLLGNEGKGISKELIEIIDIPLTIPKYGNAESLNVSTAGAILLSEFFRTT